MRPSHIGGAVTAMSETYTGLPAEVVLGRITRDMIDGGKGLSGLPSYLPAAKHQYVVQYWKKVRLRWPLLQY
ncbi:MAG: hypothetical protein JW384_02767 [Nitrosomonadaceae bacterium]|nr:hypothetical protein [Nitrosomonadaceae bacterium]